MDQIITLDVKYRFFDTEGMIHPVVITNDRSMVLVDCGHIGGLAPIEAAFRSAELNMSDLTTVIITHHDHDHMGALAALKRKYPAVQVIASQQESPYISGDTPSLRLIQAEHIQRSLPDEHKAFGLAFINILKKVVPASVDLTVSEADTFGWCGGCRVVATPGHTPGHISLYLEKHHTVITGDAAALENGALVIANPAFALDLHEAKKSLEKLLALDADTYICYHGGVWHKP